MMVIYNIIPVYESKRHKEYQPTYAVTYFSMITSFPLKATKPLQTRPWKKTGMGISPSTLNANSNPKK